MRRNEGSEDRKIKNSEEQKKVGIIKMRQLGIVTAVSADGTRASVRVQRMSACEGCHKANPGMNAEQTGEILYSACHECSMFPLETELQTDAENPAGAEAGDRVILESRSVQILGYAAGVFLAPLLLAAIFGVLGGILFSAAWAAYLAAVIGFCGAFALVKLVLDRHAKTHTVYTVVRIL